MVKLVHRKTDGRSCGASTTVGSPDVYVENKPITWNGATNSHGGGAIKASQSTVYANGIAIARRTDSASPCPYDPLNPHTNPSCTGSASTVYCGTG